MPEGDTIFRAARTLHRALADKTVTRFEAALAPLAQLDRDEPIAGRTIEKVEAAGKHCLMHFSGGLILRTHMRMNGSWHIYRPGEKWQMPFHAMRIRIDTADWVAVAFNVAALYFTLGFRQFSHHFTELQLAVKSGDIERARALLEEWRGASGVVRTREEVIRLAIEEALISSQRHVFGVIFWYVLLPGPSGAVLYRLSAYLWGRWKDLGGFGRFAARAFELIEWPAVRLTAKVGVKSETSNPRPCRTSAV